MGGLWSGGLELGDWGRGLELGGLGWGKVGVGRVEPGRAGVEGLESEGLGLGGSRLELRSRDSSWGGVESGGLGLEG